MSFEGRFIEMLEHVGYDLAEQPIRFISPTSATVAEMNFFDPILLELFARDFVFSEKREHEIHRTLWELLVNARSACHEDLRKFVQIDSYVGGEGFVSRVVDDGRGFKAPQIIEERRKQLSLYDRERVVAGGFGRGEGCNDGGVGTYCLLTFANDFQYSDKGNEVAVRFDLSN